MLICKKVAAIFLSACLLMGITITTNATVSADTLYNNFSSSEGQAELTIDEYKESLPIETQVALKQQEKPLEAYQNLIDTFSRNPDGSIHFPSEYGGCMIQGDKLIISLVNPTDEMKSTYKQLCKIVECIEFRTVEFSINDLENARIEVKKLNEQGFDIVSTGISVSNNRLNVGLNSEKHGISQALSSKNTNGILNFDFFSFLVGDQRRAQLELKNLPVHITTQSPAIGCVTVKGGAGIKNSSGVPCTFGVAGKYKGQNAFLTCGHQNQMYTDLSYSGTKIGSVAYWHANMIENNPDECAAWRFCYCYCQQ